MTGDDPLLTIGVDHDVDRTGHDHEKVVARIPFAEQVLAGGDRPASSERVERGHLGVVERGERGSIVRERSLGPGFVASNGHASMSRTRGATRVP